MHSLKKAGLVQRFAAMLLDSVLLAIFPVLLLLFTTQFTEGSLAWTIGSFAVFLILTMVLAALKDSIGGRSPGKRILGLVVRDDQFNVPARQKLILRNTRSFFWPRDLAALVWGPVRKKKGDIAAGTDVYLIRPKQKMFLTFLLLAGSAVTFFVVVFFGVVLLMKSSSSYQESVRYIKNDPGIRQWVGEEMKLGFLPTGSSHSVNGYGEAEYRITVSGTKRKATLIITLTKEPNQSWQVSYVRQEQLQEQL
ncbi:cytochrome c oxidase assembly factor Coa1 family protein [Paenibacillus sp. FJAT-26967]|uniref:cytochrome c oxidase assembly factor Coa1 family protein n=1 Tax=Paenibacillus sp. FJAT-26967 TaxID=1729690 RepID=UPI00083947C6|nr:cytochrome c oxidase assembly factor Coa1 family protein [Paenibacillus sp. FJAT-26967]